MQTARQAYQHEVTYLEQKREAAELEREAVEEGALVWKDVVKEVTAFEKRLRHEMGNGASSGSDMQSLLSELDIAMVQLESKYKLAEARGWRLLICAIGAELDAFRKGREVLRNALGIADDLAQDDPIGSTHEEPAVAPSSVTTAMHDSNMVSEGHGRHEIGHGLRKGSSEATDTDDDGPDPNLLISQDTDTE